MATSTGGMAAGCSISIMSHGSHSKIWTVLSSKADGLTVDAKSIRPPHSRQYIFGDFPQLETPKELTRKYWFWSGKCGYHRPHLRGMCSLTTGRTAGMSVGWRVKRLVCENTATIEAAVLRR